MLRFLSAPSRSRRVALVLCAGAAVVSLIASDFASSPSNTSVAADGAATAPAVQSVPAPTSPGGVAPQTTSKPAAQPVATRAASAPVPTPARNAVARAYTAPARPVADVPTTPNCAQPAPGRARCLSVKVDAAATNAQPASIPNGLSPANLASAYNLNSTGGAGRTVAVVDAYDAPNIESDLATYRAQYGLPACTTANGCFKKVNQNGAASPLPAADSGWGAETTLDVEMVSAVCPNCKILLVEANDSYLNNLGHGVNAAVNLGAKFVSNSYGGADSNSDGSFDSSYYNHAGVAITASTGDSGYGVEYPASSPYVTAVGGTTLTTANSARGWGESAWSYAGSGCTLNESKPAFQNGVATGCAGRAVADVAAVANPATGVAVYYGGWGIYGGTSVASPIVAGIYALAGQPGASDYPSSYPYSHPASFYDVTVGSNGSCGGSQLCTSTTGWDGPTGLGTPNGTVGLATPLSASVSVSGTPTAGLPTDVSVTPTLALGDSVSSVLWTSDSTDCEFTPPTAANTQLICNAGAADTVISAKVTDRNGATVTATSSVAFDHPATLRTVDVTISAAGQSGPSQSICLSAATALRATVTDDQTGVPVKGMAVSFSQQVGTDDPTELASVQLSSADGTVQTSASSATELTYSADARASGAFAPASVSVDATVEQCVAAVTSSLSKAVVNPGTAVTVSGAVTRDGVGGSVPLPGASVQIVATASGRTTVLGTATSGASGAYSVNVTPTSSSTLSTVLAATAGWSAASSPATTLTLNPILTRMTAAVSSHAVGYGTVVSFAGYVQRSVGGILTALPGSRVNIIGTPPRAAARVVAAATVNANGVWSVAYVGTTTMTLTASYAGAAGQPAAAVALGSFVVGHWTTAAKLNGHAGVRVGVASVYTGSVTKRYGSLVRPAAGLSVAIYARNAKGQNVYLTTVGTSANGTFSARLTLRQSASLTAVVRARTGYAASTSPRLVISVRR
ncbi:hypothetical protein SAMN05444157_1450 [Frankineae bacterium MT45]|nr:hypothetical protein SAMN05444157_1450 [Frankineae bacterium MT45]